MTKVRYRGPFDVLKHVRAEKGTLGLFKGFAPTLVREVAGNAVMFGVYDYLKRQLAAAQVRQPLCLHLCLRHCSLANIQDRS